MNQQENKEQRHFYKKKPVALKATGFYCINSIMDDGRTTGYTSCAFSAFQIINQTEQAE